MEPLMLVYITVPDGETAHRLGEAVVGEGLAACVNILPGMESIYRWQGQVERSRELVVLAKTRATAFPALRDRIVALHPYEVPCIVAIPVQDGLPAYLDWLAAESRGTAG